MKWSAVGRRRMLLGAAIVVVLIGGAVVVGAQTPAPSPPPDGPNIPKNALDLLTGKQFLFTLLILLFGSGIVWLEYLLVRNRVGDKIDDLAKFFIISLIIIGTLVLVGAGYSADQIAPVIGLFGTVAGYLLGRNSPPASPDTNGGGGTTTTTTGTTPPAPPPGPPGPGGT